MISAIKTIFCLKDETFYMGLFFYFVIQFSIFMCPELEYGFSSGEFWHYIYSEKTKMQIIEKNNDDSVNKKWTAEISVAKTLQNLHM